MIQRRRFFNVRTIIAITAIFSLSACGWLEPHRIEITQGNVLEAKTVDKVQVGMSRQQVRFLLGAPSVADMHHPDRWDYIQYNDKQHETVFNRRLTLYFEGNTLAQLERHGDWSDHKDTSGAADSDAVLEESEESSDEAPAVPKPEDERI